jgi:hypothetical protein
MKEDGKSRRLNFGLTIRFPQGTFKVIMATIEILVVIVGVIHIAHL